MKFLFKKQKVFSFFFLGWLSITCGFAQDTDFYIRLANAALGLTKDQVTYHPAYVRIPYPNGDVPANTGVCSDVIIRAYRKLGIDLQKEVHEDMRAHFDQYPSRKLWKLTSTDRNIDHRRVPNLATFFTRKGKALAISEQKQDYLPGDLVTWNLTNKGSLPHIGIVSAQKAADGTPLIIHNIGAGQVLQNMLFQYQITGHYRYSSK